MITNVVDEVAVVKVLSSDYDVLTVVLKWKKILFLSWLRRSTRSAGIKLYYTFLSWSQRSERSSFREIFFLIIAA